MKNRHLPTLPILLVISMLWSSPSRAENRPTQPQRAVLFAFGVAQQTTGEIGTALQNKGYSNITLNDDKQADSAAIGYRHPLNSHWSIDTHYLDQGKSKPQLQTTLPAGKTNAQAAQDIAELRPERGQGISVVALRHHPLGQQWVAQAGVGAFFWHSENEATVGNATHTSQKDGISPVLQLGLSHPLNNKIRVEGSLQHFFMPDEAVDRLAIGLAMGF